ncbi:MAG: hypothetical protein ACYCWE_02990 [Eubacteriales bacterium]
MKIDAARRTMTVLLLVCLMAFVFISCSDTPDDTGNDTAAETTAGTETAVKSDYELAKELFAGTDYGGYEFNIYYYANVAFNDIFTEAIDGDVLNDSIYERNSRTESALNVKISGIKGKDAWDQVNKDITAVVLAGDSGFDALEQSLVYSLKLAAAGNLCNLNNITAVDQSADWWDQPTIDVMSLKGTLYVLNGNINFNDDAWVQFMIFNKTMGETYGVKAADIYESVRDGKWTYDYFKERASLFTNDLNGDGKLKSLEDLFGYEMHQGAALYMLYGFGAKLAYFDEDGNFKLNTDEALVAMADDIVNTIQGDAYCVYENDYNYGINFNEGRLWSNVSTLGTLKDYRDMADDFGILPLPKYDEAQERYANPINLIQGAGYSLPVTVSDREMSGTVLSAMSAFSTDTVTAALYDKCRDAKWVRDTESVEMLELIWDNISFPLNEMTWGEKIPYTEIYYKLVPKNSFGLATLFAKYQQPIEAEMSSLGQGLMDNAGK